MSTSGAHDVHPRQERAERSRRAILSAAAHVFAERGYAGASLNEIILAAGLTKGGFYFHFPSKEALAFEVIEDQSERWRRHVQAEIAGLPRAVDRLHAVPRAIVTLARRGEGPGALRKLADELSRDPERREEVCGSLRTWIRSAADDFRAAQAEGDVRPDLDPDLFAEVAIAAFIGAEAMTEQFGDDDLERRIEALNTVLGMAASRPGKEQTE